MYMCVQCTCMRVCVYMLVHEHAHLWMTELSPGGLSSRWQLPCIFKIQRLTGNWGSPGSPGELPSSYRNPPASAFRFPEPRLQVHVTMPGSCVSSGDPTQEVMLALQACCQRFLSPGPRKHTFTLAGYSHLQSAARTPHLTSLESGSSCPSEQTRSGL